MSKTASNTRGNWVRWNFLEAAETRDCLESITTRTLRLPFLVLTMRPILDNTMLCPKKFLCLRQRLELENKLLAVDSFQFVGSILGLLHTVVVGEVVRRVEVLRGNMGHVHVC